MDIDEMLQRIRQESAKAKNVPVAFILGETGISNQGNSLRPSIRPAPTSKTTTKYNYDDVDKIANGLSQALRQVSDAWDDFQESRKRDAIYGYLRAVFKLVMDHKSQKRTKRLLRRTFKFGNLAFDRNAEPFAAVIRCTSDRKPDDKTISKWARALRYAADRKKPHIGLRTFMKKAGGVNACATQFAKYLGQNSRA